MGLQPASRFFEACGALDDPKYHTPEVRQEFELNCPTFVS